MGKFRNDATKLLEYIGGKENVAAVTHCATRMRFVLNDPKKADETKIDELSSVKGMFTNAGQFQVIIGNEVAVFYNDFVSVSGIEGASKEQTKAAAAQNKNALQRGVGVLAEIFSPLLPAIVVGGLILGLRNLLGDVDFGSGTITSNSAFWEGINDFLWLPGEAIFHFLPVGITWSITRRMNTTQILGIVLGITLVSPQLLNAYDVAGTSATEIATNWTWDFGFMQVDKIGYQAQVIPAMLAGFMLVYLERFFRKHVPEAVSMIFVPLLSLVPTIFTAHVILGPIGWTIGGWISTVINYGLTSNLNWLFSFIFAGLYSPLVITGLHHATIAIDYQLIADFGATSWWPMVLMSNMAQGSAVLAIFFLHRGNKKEEQISIPATISAYLGVTEPAMFGINLKYLYPFVAAMIGSACSAMFITVTNTSALSIGVGGIPGFLSFPFSKWIFVFIGMFISVIVTFLFTFILRKVSFLNKAEAEQTPVLERTLEVDMPNTEDERMQSKNNEEVKYSSFEEKFNAVTAGEVIPIAEVNDPVFSEKMMGEGYAIRPKQDKVYAPVSGVITSVFETKHAIGILTATGLEVLIHMGLDTVELNGKPFEVRVKEGDSVTPDTLLAVMDRKQIEEAGKETIVVVTITNQEKIDNFDVVKTGKHNNGDIVAKVSIAV